MTNEERDIITRFITRVGGTAGASGGIASGGTAGSVPASGAGAAPLPPIDKDADALIGELFTTYPEARYRLTQLAFVQEHALAEAQNRINRLQAELQQARDAAAAAAQSGGSPWGAAGRAQGSRGFLGSLFGGGGQAAAPPQAPPAYAPPPAPAYAPGYQPGMFQPQGSGFLGSALQTAAGVAGGMVLGNALMNMFSPHTAGFGGYGGFASAPAFEPVAPLPMAESGASPWAAPAPDTATSPAVDPWGSGGAMKDEPGQPLADDKFANAPPPDTSPWSTPTADTAIGQPASGDAWSDNAPGGDYDQGGGFDVSDSGGWNDDTV